jgi:murein DD-endopeptidase MepM/ murein hydrolase activator NlpD
MSARGPGGHGLSVRVIACLLLGLAVGPLMGAATPRVEPIQPLAVRVGTARDCARGVGSVALSGDARLTGTSCGDWLWPTEGPKQILRAFVAPATPYSAGHRGIDIYAPPGTAILAPIDSTVYFAGFVVDRPVLTLAHADYLASFEAVDASVEVGETVRAGEVVGVSEEGPHCSGCVHFGLRLRGVYVSPLLVLGEVPRAVLLPLSGSP